MYRFYINNIGNEYHYYELARIFFPDDEFEVIPLRMPVRNIILNRGSFLINQHCSSDREEIKRDFYHLLSDLTGKVSPWGTLTGVRPLKLAYEVLKEARREICRDTETPPEISDARCMGMTEQILSDRYLISQDKIRLLADTLRYQICKGISPAPDRAGVYIGIPFCPTRCEYCAFASNVADESEIARYYANLIREIEYTGELIRSHGTVIESVYIGGGTPTTLSADQLGGLLETVSRVLGIDFGRIEVTVEAGRPDTITADKLYALRSAGVSRISINPQTMHDETLRLIGRGHTAQDIRDGYRLASEYGFKVINADLIAGLPGESFEDFKASLDEVAGLGANNITVHTLSVKKGSRLMGYDPEYYRRNTDAAYDMVEYAAEKLGSCGFYPYYLYRQKHQTGSLENVGYCTEGCHSIYNIRIMEEKQTIIGLGAGAIGKVYYPDEDRLERIANVSNYRVYNDRFDEILKRKDRYYDPEGVQDGN